MITLAAMLLLGANGFTLFMTLNNIVQGRNTMPFRLQMFNASIGGLGLMGAVWYGAKVFKYATLLP